MNLSGPQRTPADVFRDVVCLIVADEAEELIGTLTTAQVWLRALAIVAFLVRGRLPPPLDDTPREQWPRVL